MYKKEIKIKNYKIKLFNLIKKFENNLINIIIIKNIIQLKMNL